MKALLAVAASGLLGTFLGAHFFAVPLRTFSVDNLGNQHCSGLRHGESFEVFCLSTDRPAGESANRNVDKAVTKFLKKHPVREDLRVPWQPPRQPQRLNPEGRPYRE